MVKIIFQGYFLNYYQVFHFNKRLVRNAVPALPTSVPPLDRVRQGAGAK
jgi:hypothetical protein